MAKTSEKKLIVFKDMAIGYRPSEHQTEVDILEVRFLLIIFDIIFESQRLKIKKITEINQKVIDLVQMWQNDKISVTTRKSFF